MTSQFCIRVKGLLVTVDELMEIDSKLSEMLVNVGVSFTERELSILKQALGVASEVCDTDLGKSGLTSIMNGQVSMLQRNVDLVLEPDENGFCYTKLLTCLPSMHTANPIRVARVLAELKRTLEKEPKGHNVFRDLVLSEMMLQDSGAPIDFEEVLLLMPTGQHSRIAEQLLHSKVKFTYSEAGGLFHIRDAHFCEEDEVLCSHGFWASRFIFPVIMRPGTRVGADIDFSALFVQKPYQDSDKLSAISERTEFETTIEPQNKQQHPVQPAKQHPNQSKFSDMDKELNKELSGVLDSHLEERTALLERALHELTAAANEAKQFNEQVRRASELGIKGGIEACEVASTIMPNDSSSVIERYQRKFVDNATYNMRSTKTELEPLSTRELPVMTKDVVGGFQMTPGMVLKEQEQRDRVYLINGLAAPFKNPRLNFLCHFHTALMECSFNPLTEPIDALQEIGTTRPRNPTGELMKQVVQRTFDFSEMVVVANPFRIPFLEIGMNVTEAAVMKSLDLLHAEYKTFWFQELKCLRMPQFHDDYSSYTTEVRDPYNSEHRRRRRSASRHLSSQTGTREGDSTGTEKRRTPSLLGFVRQ